MSDPLISKLLSSFDDLDRCICVTREMLANKSGVPQEVVTRVEQYADIVNKQRFLAQGLRNYLGAQNWDEVARHVKLINGLSAMIRDDAHAILHSVVGETPALDRKPGEVLS